MRGSAQHLQPQESLSQALAGFARSQVAIFLALSMAMAVPLSCQQRGMMSLFDLSASTLHSMNQAYPSGSAGISFPGLWLFRQTQSAGNSLTLVVAFQALPDMDQIFAPHTWALLPAPLLQRSQPELIPP